MTNRRRCERSFSPFVRQAGDSLHGRAAIEVVRDRRYGIDLRLDEGCTVRIDWSSAETDNILLAHCSVHNAPGSAAPHESERGPCRHLWTAIRFLDDTGESLPGRGRLQIVDMEDPITDPRTEDSATSGSQSAGLSRGPSRRPGAFGSAARILTDTSRSLDWKSTLERIDAHLEAQLTEELDARSGRSLGSQSIDATSRPNYFVEVERSRETHGWVLSVEGVATDSRDVELTRWIEGLGGRPLPAAVADATLTRLCTTGRFYTRLPSDAAVSHLDSSLNLASTTLRSALRHDGLRTVEFELGIERDVDQNGWSLSGRLCREDEQFEMRHALAIFPDGKVLFEDRILQIAAEDTASQAWANEAVGKPPWFAPQSDEQELLEVLSHLRHPPRLSLPDTLEWGDVTVHPEGRVRIHLPRSDSWWEPIRVALFYRYGSQSIAATDRRPRIPDAKQRQWICRDTDAEQHLAEKLSVDLEETYSPTCEYQLEQSGLRSVLEELIEGGWFVEAEGRPLRAPTEAELFVQSDQDWFELRGRAEFGKGSASLRDLLGAIRSGERLVRLHDGTHGMIPEEWVSRYLPLSQLNLLNMFPDEVPEPAEEDESIRFSAAQSGLLDVVLRAIEEDSLSHVKTSDSFQRLRREQSSESVRIEPPAWFRATLRGYQREGLSWMQMLSEYELGGCLADDMGLGKTVQVLALLATRRDVRRPSLIVVPRSLVFNWSAEARRFAPELVLINYTGPRRTAARTRFPQADVILTTYGVVRKEVDWLSETQFDYIVLDEATAIKNAASLAAKAIRQLNGNRRLALTGTPVENHLGELWSLFEFLNPGFGKSLRNPLEDLANQDREIRRAQVGLLGEALAPFILRRTKSEVLTELPEKNEVTISCELEPEERRLYRDLERHCRDTVREKIDELGAEQARIHVLTALLRLRQAACHPGLIDPRRQRTHSTKTAQLIGAIEELIPSGHKILVFSQFVRLLQIVRRHLDQLGVEYEYLDGQTARRGDAVRRFQEDTECSVFLISLKAGGYGLNLTAADYVFLLDPWWNPAIESQAIDRAHRMGQQRPVFAYRLIARGTVEERMLKVQAEKRELAAAVVGDTELRSPGEIKSEDLEKLSTDQMREILDPGSTK